MGRTVEQAFECYALRYKRYDPFTIQTDQDFIGFKHQVQRNREALLDCFPGDSLDSHRRAQGHGLLRSSLLHVVQSPYYFQRPQEVEERLLDEVAHKATGTVHLDKTAVTWGDHLLYLGGSLLFGVGIRGLVVILTDYSARPKFVLGAGVIAGVIFFAMWEWLYPRLFEGEARLRQLTQAIVKK